MLKKTNITEEFDLHPEEYAEVKIMTLIGNCNRLKTLIDRLKWGPHNWEHDKEAALKKAECELKYFQDWILEINTLAKERYCIKDELQGRWEE